MEDREMCRDAARLVVSEVTREQAMVAVEAILNAGYENVEAVVLPSKRFEGLLDVVMLYGRNTRRKPSRMTREEARKIIAHSMGLISDDDGLHSEAMGMVSEYCMKFRIPAPATSASLGFAVGRAYGVREERARRRERRLANGH